jgi:hypothetical protein
MQLHLRIPVQKLSHQGHLSTRSLPLRSSRRKREHRIKPIKRLNRCLFVNAEDCGVLWRIDMKSDDVSCLLFELV